MSPKSFVRKETAEGLAGWKRVKKLAPGLIWMISSIGSGTVLFTPRIGARYEYALLWMAILVTALIFVIIREIGRFTIVTGKSIISGFSELPGPKNWGVWILFVPQIFAGIITVAGLSALAGSVLISFFGGQLVVFALILIVACLLLVVTGQFKVFEKVTTVMAGILVLISLITAGRVISQWDQIINGFIPQIPQDFEIAFVIPWAGYFLAGAPGLIWYSYWVAAREYGGPSLKAEQIKTIESKGKQAGQEEDMHKVKQLANWVNTLNITSLIGIITGGLINVAFLVLGAELLAPESVIPEGVKVAEDLALLLSEVWGEVGRWFLLISVLIALTGSVLSNQDGYGRMFSDATLIVGKSILKKSIKNKKHISIFYSVTITAIFPALVFIWFTDPVMILSIGGTISAIHIPFIVFGTIYLNKRRIPKNLQANKLSNFLFWLGGIFYGLLGIYQLIELFRVEL